MKTKTIFFVILGASSLLVAYGQIEPSTRELPAQEPSAPPTIEVTPPSSAIAPMRDPREPSDLEKPHPHPKSSPDDSKDSQSVAGNAAALWNEDPSYAEAVSLWNHGNKQDALEIVRTIMNAEPKRYDARSLFAEIALSLGLIDEARTAGEDAFNLAPTNRAVLDIYTAVAAASPIDENFLKNAEENLRQADRVFEANSSIKLARARLEVERGNFSQAEALIASTADDRDAKLDSIEISASILQRQGRLKEAESLYIKTAASLRELPAQDRPKGWENVFLNMIDQLLNNGKTDEVRRTIADLRSEGSVIDFDIFAERLKELQ